MNAPLAGTVFQQSQRAARRLWSLWDIMMNYQIFGLIGLLQALWMEQQEIRRRLQLMEVQRTAHDLGASLGLGVKDYPTDQDRERIKGWLQFATQQADQLELQAVHDRIARFSGKLRSPMTLQQYLSEVTTLLEAFQDGINFKHFYRYPQQKALLFIHWEHDWKPVSDAFPVTSEDSKAAVDCYSLGHNTASVFHSMRVVEHGLRALAAAVNVTFDVQQWHTAINEIESAIRDFGDKWPKTATKSELMSFYSEAAKEFFYFKDGWRNYVSHGGDPYDEHQALSVLEHVRAFMSHLSSRFGGQLS